jgi:proline-specific peptidase
MATTTEGTLAFRGYRTWYEIVGELHPGMEKLPLLVLHGGPGLPHDYLEDLAQLADGARAVVFSDQLGCGRSDHPADAALWVMDTFVEEVAAVRDAIGLERVHLLGHSWGGWLALEYALRRPPGLASLILASTCASLPAFAAATKRLKESLPAAVQEMIDRHEAAGTMAELEYLEATMAYYKRWVCRRDPFPEHVMRSFMSLSETVYGTLQGQEWERHGQLEGLGRLRSPRGAGASGADQVGPPRRDDAGAHRASRRRNQGCRIRGLRGQRPPCHGRGARTLSPRRRILSGSRGSIQSLEPIPYPGTLSLLPFEMRKSGPCGRAQRRLQGSTIWGKQENE